MKTESKTDKMVAYMNAKYNDHFEYSAPFGGGAGATSTQIIVKSEQFPNAQIWVECYTRDGKDAFADNYVDYKYEQQTKEALTSMLNDVFKCDSKLTFGVGTKGSRNNLSNTTTFAEYIGDRDSQVGFSAVISNAYANVDTATIEAALKSNLRENGITVYGTIYFPVESSQFDDWESLPTSIISTLPNLYFRMDDINSFEELTWRNSK
jgi:hypothetical protein